MTVESARRRELAEFVTDHLLGHLHRDVLVAIADAEQQSDELRQNGRAAAPDPGHLVPTRSARSLCLLEQIAVDERTFPNRTRHGAWPLLLLADVAARHDEFLGALVAARLLAFGRLAPRRHRMASARATAFAAAKRMIDRVHRNAAVVRTAAHPALAAGLANRDVHVVGVRH